ncbi:tetraacyldisaccharide 4'-kinase [Halobacteriovorax marinus]|uniref:Tetraacyldisaccharide 4'-kinase n=1 Tax=Halobacteriovorax marinus (strain ATCC BAA-682 / DSM 15412 / SJ) TaxID=862908 RepID=E1X522_HALMS|nr:tetraacyldisaccharide 4'-kinase [Halobacteriovorax marinus]ATH06921.1 tetraacyldisaccharide 4'-kinase [Halobacteriovorax marinus]CBW25493.1 putative tetraacyldisaccharide kinase [Halobacteriovorax marinus SJ]
MNNFVSNIFQAFLFPLTCLWEWVYRIRRFMYNYGLLKKNYFQVPIISIGNLTFGGTGKTPFTLWLSDYLGQEKGKRVLVLMRGYKGNLEHGSGLLKSGARLGYNPFDYGDEALLLARRLKNTFIAVGKKRSENLSHYFDEVSPDVVLLDDGHQHLKLERNLNIVLFDSLMSLDKYKVAPGGYMREGFSALKDAEVVVLGRADLVTESKLNSLKEIVLKYNPRIKFAHICYRPTGLFNISCEKVFDVDHLVGKRVICVAGIASPSSFFKYVETLGIEIIHQVSFPDHHYFKAEEISRLIDLSKEEDVYILTTEKDIVKLRRVVDTERLLYLEIKVEFLSGESEVKKAINSTFE